MIQLPPARESVELKAAEKLSELGYSIGDYSTEIAFESNDRLLDSLQNKIGRSVAISGLKHNPDTNLKPYYWQLTFTGAATSPENTDGRGSSDESLPFDQVNEDLTVRLDTEGRVFELHNPSEVLPSSLVQRDVIRTVLADSNDAETMAVLSSVSDSLLKQVLNFDFQRSLTTPRSAGASLSEHLQQGMAYRLSGKDAESLAVYYLRELGWNPNDLQADTVTIHRVKSINTARVRFRSMTPVMGQHLTLTAQVTPTGSLIGLNSQYNSTNNSRDSWENIWSVIRGALIFLFGLGCIIIFFFRIRARAIDTQSSLVIAILAGLIFPTYILLESLNKIGLFNGSTEWVQTILLLVRMGMAGAFSSVAFFVLFSIGDSITRQHWSSKLKSFDYLRQGLIYNKPVGLVVLRSLALAFILAGMWTVALWLLPEMYIHFEPVFLSGAVSWPPLYLLLKTAWFSFTMVVSIFLIIGNQTYAQTKNRWYMVVITTLVSGIVVPLFSEFGPPLEEFALGAIMGASLALIFLRWDFLTVLVSHFLFLGLLGSSSGWVIPGSPDTYIFVMFIFFMLFLFTGGSLALLKGKEERVLTRYVPEYVEELAQEERIKQELQIAREVQQSFLPVNTPNIEGLDIAAFCRPAYETGGDYYDFIQLDKHRVALAIGDVSGKGIQAAFYMTFTKGILHSLCRETNSPAELLIKANRLFCDNARKGTFISLVYGILDIREQTFTFARAGHNPVIRMNSATCEVEELQPVGLGLGLTKDAPFSDNIREIKLELSQDDVIVLYTDGIVEALSEAHEFYGNKRLVSLLKKHNSGSSSHLMDAIFDEVTTFIGKAKQHDDMTSMVIKINGNQG